MKALSGRDFARLIERRGWQLLRISGSHHIYGKPAVSFDCRFRFTAIDLSRSDCCGIWQSLRRFPTTSGAEALPTRIMAGLVPQLARAGHAKRASSQKGNCVR
jgi:hypothetical protein